MQNITGFLSIIENIEKNLMIYCSTGSTINFKGTEIQYVGHVKK